MRLGAGERIVRKPRGPRRLSWGAWSIRVGGREEAPGAPIPHDLESRGWPPRSSPLVPGTASVSFDAPRPDSE